MRYVSKHAKKYKNRSLDIAIRAFIAALSAILTAVIGYFTASYLAGTF